MESHFMDAQRTLAGHTAISSSGTRIQSLEEHCRNVAELCAASCRPLGLESLGRVTGLLHDMGKTASKVQGHLYGTDTSHYNHSSAGMRWIWENYKNSSDKNARLAAQFVAVAIGCHHSERIDVFAPNGSAPWLERMYSEQALAVYSECCDRFFQECICEREIREIFSLAVNEMGEFRQHLLQSERKQNNAKDWSSIQFMLGLAQRYLFSALIDADWSDAACFDQGVPPKEASPPHWEELCLNAETFFSKLDSRRPIDVLRGEISEQCRSAGQQAKAGIFRLYVPTGGGKTYSGLRYCLHAAFHRKASRIFYFAPFRSIIGQNTKEFQKVLGDPNSVLEHHSDVTIDFDNENLLRQMARWQGIPMISTTMVQFLNTLFAAPRQNVRRMVSLANSILLFDEIQSLPVRHTYLFNEAVNFLSEYLGCTIILCTATQPELQKVDYPIRFSEPKDLVPDYNLRFDQFRRTKIVPLTLPGGYDAEKLATLAVEKLSYQQSLLMILNTRSAVETVFSILQKRNISGLSLFCLTTHLCPRHRQDVIEEIRTRLSHFSETQKLLCISTQLIEAGVDLSFDCVIRSTASLPSIAQAAGRCNRNAEVACRDVYLAPVDERLEDLSHLKELHSGKLATQQLLRRLPPESDLLSPKSIQQYYQIFFSDHRQTEEMGDPVQLEQGGSSLWDDLFELLSCNRNSVLAYVETSGRQKPGFWTLQQAFGTAEANFRALDDGSFPVVVPYSEDGKAVIGRLRGESASSSLLNAAQPYVVGVSPYEKQCLERSGALLYAQNNDIALLNEPFYDSQKGIQLHAGELPGLFV